ncbi:MAG: RNA polymerase sigma factor [Bacteroidota bacterium]
MRLSSDQLESAIKGCAAGDRRCQEQLFREFFGKMMAVCMRYTRDRDTAQDILQEAYIKAFEKIGDFNFNGSFEGWLRRIVVNTSIDHFRKNKNIVLLEDDRNISNDEDDESPDRMEEENDSSIYENIKPEMVLDAMQRLSPAYRTVFNLYVYENYSHKEIAEMLNINIGTSKSNLAKAKMNLKKILEQQLSIK